MSISKTLQATLAAAALAASAAAAPVLAQTAPAQTAPAQTPAQTPASTAASAPATAAQAAPTGAPVVVERASNGRPTSVRIDGTVYKVCMTQSEDGCIQPRAAGLNWGNQPLAHWPGRPASEMNGRARTTTATPG